MAPPNNKGRRIYKVNAVSYAKLIALMLDGTMDNRELAAETGLHPVTVQLYARELHRAGAAFICQRRADDLGRHTIKVFQVGRGKDASPIRKSSMVRMRELRKRRSARSPQGLELAQVWGSSTAMTRTYDEAPDVAPRPGAESKTVEETSGEPSA